MCCLSPVQRAFDVTERITTCQLHGLVHGSVHLLKMSVYGRDFLPAVTLEARCNSMTVVWKVYRLKPCSVLAVETVRACFNSTWNCVRTYFVLYNDQQMHNYITNYHTPTCFDTIVSSSGSLLVPSQVTQVCVCVSVYTHTHTHTHIQNIYYSS